MRRAESGEGPIDAAGGRFFEAIADHAGPAYLRYSFTRGTETEVEALRSLAGLGEGDLVLDVGCGPGRHSHALARRGICVVGVDVAWSFVTLAHREKPGGAAFARADVRRLPVRPGGADAVICLCQGGFGLLGGGVDEEVALAQMAGALRRGGRLVLTAFSAYFLLRHLEAGDRFDRARGVNHETVSVRDAEGVDRGFDLWTTCFTPRELRLMCAGAGLAVRELWSVTPGRLTEASPEVDRPEWLLVAEKP